MSQQSSLFAFFKKKDSDGKAGDAESKEKSSPKTPITLKESGKRPSSSEKKPTPPPKKSTATPKKLVEEEPPKKSTPKNVAVEEEEEEDAEFWGTAKSSKPAVESTPIKKTTSSSSDDMFSQFMAKKSSSGTSTSALAGSMPKGAEEDDRPVAKSNRKKKVVISDDEGDEDFALPLKRKSTSSSSRDLEDSSESEKESKPKSASSATKKTVTPASAKTKKAATPSSSGKKSSAEKSEQRYFWLEDIKDKQGRGIDEEGYDCRTLLVPAAAYKNFSNFEKQFWDIKSNYWDVVIFFKKGKFYELYEKDSEIGFRELGLKMTERVNMSMVGVPEKSFKKYASQLINLGYKVGRVEQMETANDASKRQKQESAKAKVCNRELCEILTLGTLVEEDLIPSHEANYVMSICVRHLPPVVPLCFPDSLDHQENPQTRTVGVCLAEVSTANFYLHSFVDNEQYTETETIILRCRPREIVTTHPKGSMISETLFKSLKRNFEANTFVLLQPGKEFWDSRTAVEEIKKGKYFADGQWPALLQDLVDSENVEGLQSVGGCISYLRHLLLDADVIPAATFSKITSLNHSTLHMVLDSTTLCNLSILENDMGTKEGTLLKYLDNCSTAFGRRLLRNWICHPVQNRNQLNDRYDCIQALHDNNTLRDQLVQKLKKFTDLVRAMGRLINVSSKRQGVMFDDTCNRKLKEFAILVDNFDVLQSLWDSLPEDLPLCGIERPDMREAIKRLSDTFSREEAREGKAIISEGVLPELDEVQENIKRVKGQLEEYLEEQQRETKNKGITYYMPANQKDVYQMVVDKKWVDSHKGNIPKDWTVTSETKAQCRYYSPELRAMASELTILNEDADKATQTVTQHLVKMFGEYRAVWNYAVQATAQLDCLISLSFTIDSPSGPTCRPTFCESGVSATNLRHACMALTQSFVPNDVSMGGDAPSTLIITGSNMSGKSTMLRQVCIALVMAQVGAFVAAESFTFAPVDRIFTRIGARDRMLQNQSTFMVEMAESASVLRYATEKSLVVFDELGRGTSTFDGYAIAYAVVSEILEMRSLCMFATHYQRLANEFEGDKRVGYKHMTCMIEDDSKRVVFLYKFVDGVSPRSYGVHCASLANIPRSVLDNASQRALDMEILTDLQTDAAHVQNLICRILEVKSADGDPAPIITLQKDVAKLFVY